MRKATKKLYGEREICSETDRPLTERWVDEHNRIVEERFWNYHPEEMSLETKTEDYDTGKSLVTVECLQTGVIYEESHYIKHPTVEDIHSLHREDGDAVIVRNRRTGADEYRARYFDGDEYEVTQEGLIPVNE